VCGLKILDELYTVVLKKCIFLVPRVKIMYSMVAMGS